MFEARVVYRVLFPEDIFEGNLDSTLSGEPLELMGKESATRFCNPTHSILILGFGECCADEFFGNLLGNQPVEPSRMFVPAYFEHLENEAADSNYLFGW